MEVEVGRHDGTVVVSLTGELDASNSDQLRDAVGGQLDTRVELVEVRAGGLDFIDSSGVSELVEIHHAVNANGGRVRLVDPSSAVRRIIEITGLADTFGL